jgi:hypothetical protein
MNDTLAREGGIDEADIRIFAGSRRPEAGFERRLRLYGDDQVVLSNLYFLPT